MADYELLCGIGDGNNRYAYVALRSRIPPALFQVVVNHLEIKQYFVDDITADGSEVAELEITRTNGFSRDYIPFLRDGISKVISAAGYDVMQNYHIVPVAGMEDLFEQSERQRAAAN